MPDSPSLGLPFIDQGQAQKHVTHNEALRVLDAAVQLSLVDRDVSTPPASPAEGARYLVGASPSGAFAGQAGKIAVAEDGAWRFLTPRAGFLAQVADEGIAILHDGAAWNPLGHAVGAVENVASLGLGTTSDAGNRFAAKLAAALFTARSPGEGGSGDVQVKLNKTAAGNVASQLWQTNYSGRAEVGLVGDDRFRVRVSADGSTWRDGLVIDPATGFVAFPGGAGGEDLIVNGGFSVWQRQVSFSTSGYTADRWYAAITGSVTVEREAAILPLANARASLKWTAGAAGSGCDLCQAIEDVDVIALRDQTVTFSVHVRRGASFQGALTVAIESGNTVNVVSSGVWTVLAQTSVVPGAGWTRVAVTATVPANAVALRVRIGSATSQNTGDGIYVGQAQLDPGPVAGGPRVAPLARELARCQRYFAKSYSPGSYPGAITSAGAVGSIPTASTLSSSLGNVFLPVPMRAVPALTLYNPATGGTASPIRNTTGNTDHTASVTLAAEQNFFVNATSSVPANNRLQTHWVANAELA